MNFAEKDELLDNATNGTDDDGGWLSPNQQQLESPKCGHSRQGSNASANSVGLKKWIDVITGKVSLFEYIIEA